MNMYQLVNLAGILARRRRSSGIDSDTIMLIAGIAVAVIVVIVIVAIVASKKKSKKKQAVQPVEYQGYAEPVVNTPVAPIVDIPMAPVVNTPVVETPVAPVAPVVETPAAPVVEEAPKKTYVKLVNVQNGATYEAPMDEQVTIGKRDCTINIADDNSISGKHCQIYMYETNYVLADMESTNGTKLNDYKIDVPVFIENGSILGIGKQKFTVTFEQK